MHRKNLLLLMLSLFVVICITVLLEADAQLYDRNGRSESQYEEREQIGSESRDTFRLLSALRDIVQRSETSTADEDFEDAETQCEPITLGMCQNLPYNETIMPNFFNHQSQEEAAMEIHTFYPLIKVQCSTHLKFFICSLYTPVCGAVGGRPIPPCRYLCSRSRAECERSMDLFGIDWPFACSQFPIGGYCIGEDSMS